MLLSIIKIYTAGSRILLSSPFQVEGTLILPLEYSKEILNSGIALSSGKIHQDFFPGVTLAQNEQLLYAFFKRVSNTPRVKIANGKYEQSSNDYYFYFSDVEVDENFKQQDSSTVTLISEIVGVVANVLMLISCCFCCVCCVRRCKRKRQKKLPNQKQVKPSQNIYKRKKNLPIFQSL